MELNPIFTVMAALIGMVCATQAALESPQEKWCLRISEFPSREQYLDAFESFSKEELVKELEGLFGLKLFFMLSEVFAKESIFDRIRDKKLGSRFIMYAMLVTNKEWHTKYVDVFFNYVDHAKYKRKVPRSQKKVLIKLMEEIGNDKIYLSIKKSAIRMMVLKSCSHRALDLMTTDDTERGANKMTSDYADAIANVVEMSKCILDHDRWTEVLMTILNDRIIKNRIGRGKHDADLKRMMKKERLADVVQRYISRNIEILYGIVERDKKISRANA